MGMIKLCRSNIAEPFLAFGETVEESVTYPSLGFTRSQSEKEVFH